jgi:hypothetical protein
MSSFGDSRIFLLRTQTFVKRNTHGPTLVSDWPKSLPSKTLAAVTTRHAAVFARLNTPSVYEVSIESL